MEAARASPAFALSIDEKGRFLAVALSYLDASFCSRSIVLAYRELPGFTAADIAKSVADACNERGLDLRRLCAFTADGASVMGTRAAMSAGGDNVARRLSDAAQRAVLVTHCAAHRLQLCVSSALHADAYLQELEGTVHRLFGFLRGPSGSGDAHTLGLLFWSEVAEEEMLTSLGTGKARWLSLLAPLRKLEASYVTLMAFLAQQFETENDREKKKKTQKTFTFLASWEFRFTLAGIVDILAECWLAKSKLEKRVAGGQIRRILDELEAGLAVLSERERRVAARMHQTSSAANRDAVGVDPVEDAALAVERCLVAYARDRGSKLLAAPLPGSQRPGIRPLAPRHLTPRRIRAISFAP